MKTFLGSGLTLILFLPMTEQNSRYKSWTCYASTVVLVLGQLATISISWAGKDRTLQVSPRLKNDADVSCSFDRYTARPTCLLCFQSRYSIL
ncbi:hypothetical protein K456DRAFT_647428 [Colletotrichum gloeosporioides 23]|nr:hypothetical protein K456DRAFT_647428 [Colletotrichum gloeosporioides 23]